VRGDFDGEIRGRGPANVFTLKLGKGRNKTLQDEV